MMSCTKTVGVLFLKVRICPSHMQTLRSFFFWITTVHGSLIFTTYQYLYPFPRPEHCTVMVSHVSHRQLDRQETSEELTEVGLCYLKE